MLPAYIQNFNGSLEDFKKFLDSFPSPIPDKPAISGMFPDPVTRSKVIVIRNSNALVNWINHLQKIRNDLFGPSSRLESAIISLMFLIEKVKEITANITISYSNLRVSEYFFTI